jgi:hypothetical protein
MLIRHCLLEHKQNIANAFNIIGVSNDFTLEVHPRRGGGWGSGWGDSSLILVY